MQGREEDGSASAHAHCGFIRSNMETMKAIEQRQSCRSYLGEQISEKELQTVLEAANAAPIGGAKFETVKITVIQNADMLAKINAAAVKATGNPDIRPTYGAPTVILVSAQIPENQNPSLYCNAACIVENMSLAATDLGLGTVYLLGVMAALSADEELCRELMVPQGFVPVSAMALGKAAAPFKERKLTLSKIATDYIK